MPMANPRRNVNEESIRVQEFTGGFNAREMMGDYDVNPNEDADGLAHHSREGGASSAFMEQLSPKKRREKALKEMEGELPHVSIKPEEIADTLSSTPQSKDEDMLAESRTGVDMGLPGGLSASTGAQISPVMREGPGLLFGRSNDAFEDAWSIMKNREPNEDDIARVMEEKARDVAARELQNISDANPGEVAQGWVGGVADRISPTRWGGVAEGQIIDANEIRQYMAENNGERPPPSWFQQRLEEKMEGDPNTAVSPDFMRPFIPVPSHGIAMPHFPPDDPRYVENPDHPENARNVLDPNVGEFGFEPDESFEWQQKNASADVMLTSDIIKAKRKKKGRKYEEDEESDEEERRSKAKRKRKKKRKMKEGKKEASRDIKGKTARRAASAEQNLDRGTKRQAFSNRRMFSGNPRASAIPLRLRDPIAYQRKLANEKMRRQQGALPRDITVHRDTSGLQGKIQTIGMEPRGTKMGVSAPKGTSMSQFKPSKAAMASGSLLHDPLGGDPLMAKSKGLSRTELLDLKRQIEKLVRAIGKINKSPPVFDENAKRGNQASPEKASDPGDKHLIRPEDQAAYRFADTSIMPAAGAAGAGKR